ncbi:MAG: hypothetical protein GXO50_08570 [Chlorobi bacterium]|nr:hypothetical protein [Chlorobiota bacterium]
MNFLYPKFLFALIALLIPVIIHLFGFRRYKAVYFSNINFLKAVKKETDSKSKLKHLLVLIMRMLTLASLIIAFARPYIPEKNEKNKINQNKIAVYIDNSFSTNAESKYGKILDAEKQKAAETADAFPENTKILFLTNDFALKHQHFVSKEQFKNFVGETNISPEIRSISEVSEKIKAVFEDNKIEQRYPVFFISDFQKSSADLNKLKPDSLQERFFIPVTAEKTDNIYIDSVWFENPGRPFNREDIIYVKIKNASKESYTQMPVKLFLNGEMISTGTFNVKANEEITKQLKFINKNTGIINGEVKISDFPVVYDNVFYFNYELADTCKILIISEKGNKNKFITDACNALPHTSVKNISLQKSGYEKFENYNVIISDGLKKITSNLKEKYSDFTENGGILILFPTVNISVTSYNSFLNALNLNYITGKDTTETYADKINYDSRILKDVFKQKEKNPDMPVIFKHLIFGNLSNIKEEVILYSEKNDKLIINSDVSEGKVFIFASYPDKSYGNLIYHPLWTSVLYNMIFYNTAGKKIFYTIGNNEIVRIKYSGDDLPVRIVNKEKNIDIIPQYSKTGKNTYELQLNEVIQKDGHFKIMSGNKILSGISLDYNRKESDLTHYSLEELKKLSKTNQNNIKSVLNTGKHIDKEIINNQNRGINLHIIFLIAAIIFTAAEIIIIKLLNR